MGTVFYRSNDLWRHPNLDQTLEFVALTGKVVKSSLKCIQEGVSVFSGAYTCASFPPFDSTFRSIHDGAKDLRKIFKKFQECKLLSISEANERNVLNCSRLFHERCFIFRNEGLCIGSADLRPERR